MNALSSSTIVASKEFSVGLPTGCKRSESGGQEKPSRRIRSTSGCWEKTSGRQNFASGRQNFASGSQKSTSGRQNFAFGSQKSTSGRQNFASGSFQTTKVRALANIPSVLSCLWGVQTRFSNILTSKNVALSGSSRQRSRQRGVTLIEMLIVIAILALLTGGMFFANSQIQRARLRSSAARVASAMRVGVQRASSTGKHLRLVIDIEQSKIWLEEAEGAFAIKQNDLAGGADPAIEAEHAAVAEASRVISGIQPPRTSFRPIPGPGGQPRELYGGIVIKAVDSAHDVAPRTLGRGYVYFFATEAERASVQLKIRGNENDKDAFSVVLAPLTGKPSILDGAHLIVRPRDDNEASEAEDDGR